MEKKLLLEDISEDLSIRKIADKRNVSANTVRYWLSKHGLKTNTKTDNWDIDKLKSLCNTEESIHKVIIGMGKSPTSASYKKANKLFSKHGITPPNYVQDTKPKVGIENYFVPNARRNNQRTKRLLIEFHEFLDECSECGLGSVWNGKPITLQLDHIDGDNLNNLVSNLRILCPNCHTQTPTYCRNKNA